LGHGLILLKTDYNRLNILIKSGLRSSGDSSAADIVRFDLKVAPDADFRASERKKPVEI
jgi:hypothetical protein